MLAVNDVRYRELIAPSTLPLCRHCHSEPIGPFARSMMAS
jgi:hypothetical protein